MTLSELLKPELILPKIVCASKDELIAKLVDLVYNTGIPELPLPKEDLLKTITKREQIGGTLLPSGLSIPHARLQNFENFVLAFGIPAEPIFHEGIQIQLSALMITNQPGTPWYLPVLAVLTKISRDKEYFSRLCGAENPDDVVRILRERDPELA